MSKHFNDEYPAHSGVGVSKEQTPIEQFLENELTEMYHNKEMSYDTYSRLHDLISIASEEEVKAKVIEALEREVPKSFKMGNNLPKAYDLIDFESKDYLNNIVKPKYE